MFLSLLPQVHLWVVRGKDWNGTYVSPQGDEPLYSAYINALIDGRARKNDPFLGKDNAAGAPLPESTFSIQVVPAYAIAYGARVLGLSAATAFIFLNPVSAVLSSLAVFWLITSVLGDYRVGAAGTLFVLCLGGFWGSYGVFGTLLDVAVPALPFLRRYQPSASFPLFFVINFLVWRGITTDSTRRLLISASLVGVCLALLIFSYLYLWTAAASWLGCISLLWFSFRPADRRKTLAWLATAGLIPSVAVVPYVYLLSHRAATLDEHQTLISTHSPDLFRVHELLGLIIILVIVVGLLRHRIERTDPRALYAVSLALLPFIVFNQQVLTGRTMQVFHFEIFVVNYTTAIALLITAGLFWNPFPRRFLVWMAVTSLLWGVMVVGLPARIAFVPAAVENDLSIPVLLRLKELSREDGTLTQLRKKGETSNVVFSPSVRLMRLLPTWTAQGTLLSLGSVDFGTLTRSQRQQFFYMHLYYSKVSAEDLRKALSGASDNPTLDQYARSVIFGHERITPALDPNYQPIQAHEIDREVRAYEAYANSFSREEVLRRPLRYAIYPSQVTFDYSNLDRWYERDNGQPVGSHVLYHLKLRD